MRRARLDAELVRRGLARSREHAADLVHEGRVSVSGQKATKPATAVAPGDALLVTDDQTDENWASRGAHKLIGALDKFTTVQVAGARCLDAGASTGGFTDVLLRRGATQVVCADVGYGQLVWKLQTDDRVVIHDRTNVRTLTPEIIGGTVDLVVADLSFISLTLVLPALTGCVTDEGDLVLMVKPQFEVGKDRLGAGGVVRDPALRAGAVVHVVTSAASIGLGLAGVVASPLPGPSGNVEFFIHLRKDTPIEPQAVLEMVETAVRQGPS
ncbi:TlyA family RNA methyltransferase [Nakamurella antarctica]|uniref:TlyA family RNA methyltransferase n=1 Tax=Nakamurella antarctica TaxID=1902245 RepID=A0A3G8ZSV9_9ACTN|nr:TlyA family RNA methyltransferase [Nakamurella antarctica]AZI57584.1 TlyA family RNA methyltransferase [Nakamurella antarctica]